MIPETPPQEPTPSKFLATVVITTLIIIKIIKYSWIGILLCITAYIWRNELKSIGVF